MNAVRFDDALDGRVGEEARARLAGSPLVKWEDLTTEQFAVADAPPGVRWPGGLPRLPFDVFRVGGLYTYGDGCQMRFRAWVAGIGEGEPQMIVVCQQIDAVRVPGEHWQNMEDWFAVIGIAAASAETKRAHWSYEQVGVMTPLAREWLEDGTGMGWVLVGEWLFRLSLDFQNPSLHLCRVLPRGSQGRSVEWVRAREHVVLVHKGHPANRRDVGPGAVVGEGLQRVAHCRRAHYRMLRSPRFVRKRGSAVWVRSTWVGPTEWRDHSGQIYQICPQREGAKQ